MTTSHDPETIDDRFARLATQDHQVEADAILRDLTPHLYAYAKRCCGDHHLA